MGLNLRDRRARVRLAVAREAARAMYWEGVDQYFDAKRIAARRVLGRDARGAQFRARELPSNGEIRDALLQIVELAEGRDRSRRLFAMRVEALTVLRALEAWHPRLIGSVATGHARRGSDIDVHVFTDSLDRLELELFEREWVFDTEEVLIKGGTEFKTYQHLHVLDRLFPVELSVYPLRDRRITTRSSTDGQSIDRVSASRLRQRIKDGHPELWREYIERGELDLEGLDDGLTPGEFDGLLAELDGD